MEAQDVSTGVPVRLPWCHWSASIPTVWRATTAAATTLCTTTACHHATRADSQWEDEQSYTYDQLQALGCCCPPYVVAPLRLERQWQETLSCRVCRGEDWKDFDLAGIRMAPSTCVFLLQAEGLQTKL